MIIKNDCFSLEQIADSGQCFRMNKTSDGKYTVAAFGKVLYLSQRENEITFECSEEDYKQIWEKYFDIEDDYAKYLNVVKNGEDEYLKKAADFGKGIRILNQQPWETLISFIISQQMRIPRIKQLIEIICKNYGKEIENGFYEFPSPEEMKDISENALSDLGFGYRSKYIVSAVRDVLDGKFLLEKPFEMQYEECRDYLKTLNGVGNKVADCVSLFAYHKTDAFPIDTWMKKIIERHYNGNFDKSKYSGYEGIMQQYMFYYERYNG